MAADDKVLTYVTNDNDSTSLNKSDLKRLRPGGWLNDELVNFAVHYLRNNMTAEVVC